jgi:hypothetical protein
MTTLIFFDAFARGGLRSAFGNFLLFPEATLETNVPRVIKK